MRYKLFPIEADFEIQSSHISNNYKRSVILSNIDINPALVKILSGPVEIKYESSSVCMSEEHPFFNFDIFNGSVADLQGSPNIFYMKEYSEMFTNLIKREFPQVYRDYGGRDNEI